MPDSIEASRWVRSVWNYLWPSVPRDLGWSRAIYMEAAGRTAEGRLRRSSVSFRAHLIMIALGMGLGLAGWALGIGASIGSLLAVLLFTILFGPFLAGSRTLRSVRRARDTGQIDQLCLTALSDREVFTGKYWAMIAPCLITQKYFVAYGTICLVGGSLHYRTPEDLLLLAAYLSLVLLYRHCASCQISQALDRAARPRSLRRDWSPYFQSSPLLTWVRLNILFSIALILPLLIALAILCLFVFGLDDLDTFLQRYAGFATLLLPVSIAWFLQDSEAEHRDLAMIDFRARLIGWSGG